MRFWGRRRGAGNGSWFVTAGLVVVGAFALVAVFAPLLAPFDPQVIAGESLAAPSGRHLLGTDDVGHDVFSTLVWGARSSLTVALGAGLLTVAVATVVGATAGLIGGRLDMAVMRLVDVWLAMPVLPVLMLVAAAAGPSRWVAIVTLGLLAWPVNARLVRAQVLSLRERGFVHAARGFGATPWHVVRHHLVPAVGPILVAGFVTMAGAAVVLEAGLAFLGLGDPTAVSWGHVLNRAVRHQGVYFGGVWTWLILPAGLAITTAVVGFTFLGVGLEPRLNPRWRRGTTP